MRTSLERSDALTDTLCDCDLQDVCVEWADVLSDTLLDDELLKGFPIIGTILGLGKFGVSLADRLFLKKLLCFLSEVAHVPAGERARTISEIDRSPNYQIKVGEKLLYLIDKSEDHETAKVVAFLFTAFLSQELSYDDFLRASRAVQNMMAADVRRFVNDQDVRWFPWVVGELLHTGLVEFDESEIAVAEEGQNEWEIRMGHPKRYRIEDGQPTVSITKLGERVRSILRCRMPAMQSSAAYRQHDAKCHDGQGTKPVRNWRASPRAS